MTNIQDMLKTYFMALLAVLKNSFIAAATVFSAFVAPIQDLLTFVSLLIVLDFITGVTAAKYRGEVRQSTKMMKSVYKMLFYIGGLMMAQLFDRHMRDLFTPHLFKTFIDADSAETLLQFKFLAALSFIISIRELKSVDENWESIFGWSFIKTGFVAYDKIISLISLFKTKK